MNDDTASRATREGIDKTMATGADAIQGVQKGFRLAQVNTDAAFDFVREVATAKGPSDLVQTWTTHATKQFDVLTKQASELTILGQRFANTTADSVTRAGKGSKPE